MCTHIFGGDLPEEIARSAPGLADGSEPNSGSWCHQLLLLLSSPGTTTGEADPDRFDVVLHGGSISRTPASREPGSQSEPGRQRKQNKDLLALFYPWDVMSFLCGRC
jgi:hypothetical protein